MLNLREENRLIGKNQIAVALMAIISYLAVGAFVAGCAIHFDPGLVRLIGVILPWIYAPIALGGLLSESDITLV